MKKIGPFAGDHRWLSNFYPAKVILGGQTYPSVEHAFQAAKAADPEVRKRFQALEKPSEAKKLGREIDLRPDWEKIKLGVMFDLLQQKFRHGELRDKLYDTYPAKLVEENDWGDKFWGVCDGVGQNWLGRLLMIIRSRLFWEGM